MEFKITPGMVKEVSEAGEGVAVIATLNVVDHDGDVTLPGAFGEQVAAMVPAHMWEAAPIGKAKIHESGNDVLADFKINRNTTLGKDWYEAIKFDLENPPTKQEYSYGFRVTESAQGDFETEGMEPIEVRFIKGVIVAEISPVLKGAGINTRTLALKSKLEAGLAPDTKGLSLEDHLALLATNAEEALERLADIEAKRLIGKGRREDMMNVSRLFGDIKAALDAPLPEEIALRLLANNYQFNQKRLDNRAAVV